MRAGKTRTFVYDVMIGKKASFKGDGLSKVAAALECSVDYLTGATNAVNGVAEPLPLSPRPHSNSRMPYAGIIETGMYRRPPYPGTNPSHLNIMTDPAYPPQHQLAYLVRGNGLDERGIVDGMVLTCVKAEAAKDAIQNGSIVIIRMSLPGSDEIEFSAREVRFYPEKTVFRALSKSQEIQPIVIAESEDAGVTIIALALEARLSLRAALA